MSSCGLENKEEPLLQGAKSAKKCTAPRDFELSNFSKKRRIGYLIISLIALVLPFIRFNDTHFFLLSFEHKALHLFFVKFDMQEFYMLPFLLILFFVFIVTMTTIGGRVWCGWGCPQTIFRVIFRDLIQTKLLGLYNPVNRQKYKNTNAKNAKIALSVVLWMPIAFIAAADFLWYFMPPEEFVEHLLNPAEHKLAIGIWLGVAAFLVFDVCFLAEKFCIYVCPYARIQSVMFDNDTMQVIYNEGRNECINCNACVKICPTHIDIRKGMQLECINCLECVDACEKVMGPRGKTGLIEWNSANSIATKKPVKFLRTKVIISAVVLSVATIALFIAGGNKESVLLNINRNTELYHIKTLANQSQIIDNSYVFLLQNIDSKPHNFKFEIDDERIKFVRPKEEVSVLAKSKRKFVVVLRTEELLANSTQNTPLSLNLKLYATDDEKISTTRKIVFVFPKTQELEDAKH